MKDCDIVKATDAEWREMVADPSDMPDGKSVEELGKLWGMCGRTARKRITVLCDRGVLKRGTRKDTGKTHRTPVYMKVKQ